MTTCTAAKQQHLETPQTQNTAHGDVVPARGFAGCATNPIKGAFANPRGALGRLAGWAMSRKNTPLNEFAVQLLAPQAGHKVLEIGYGPGKGLALLAALVGENGFIAGLDISELMLKNASRRNNSHILHKRMRLELGRADDIPHADETFDKILSVSNVQFWRPASKSFAETLRVLKPGGTICLGIHVLVEGQRRMTPGLYPEEREQLCAMLQRAGFVNVSQHPQDDGVHGYAIIAQRPE